MAPYPAGQGAVKKYVKKWGVIEGYFTSNSSLIQAKNKTMPTAMNALHIYEATMIQATRMIICLLLMADCLQP